MYIGLPLEIWISVFEYLPRKTLRQTGLASQTLHIAACRLLYRSIRLTEQSPNVTATLELLEKNPSLARCIINAHLIFTGKSELQDRWIAALRSWEHLEKLEIHDFPSWIPERRGSFMRAISALPIKILIILPQDGPPAAISPSNDTQLDVERPPSTIRQITIRASGRGSLIGTTFYVVQEWMEFLDPKEFTHITLRHGEGARLHEPSLLQFFQTTFPRLSHLRVGAPFSSPLSASHEVCTEVLSAFLAKTDTLVSLSLAEDMFLAPLSLSSNIFSTSSLPLIQELRCTPCQLRALSDVPLHSLKQLRTLAIAKSFLPDFQSDDRNVYPIIRSVIAQGRLDTVKRVGYFSIGFRTGPIARFQDYGHGEVMAALGDLCPKATVVEGTFQALGMTKGLHKDVFSPFPLAEEIVIYGSTREILRNIPAGQAALRRFFSDLTSVCPKARSFTLNKSVVDDGVDDHVFSFEKNLEGELTRVTEESYE